MKAKFVKESLNILEPKSEEEIVDNLEKKVEKPNDAKLIADIIEKYPHKYKYFEALREFRFIIYPAGHKFGPISATVFFRDSWNDLILRKNYDAVGSLERIDSVDDIPKAMHKYRKILRAVNESMDFLGPKTDDEINRIVKKETWIRS